MAITAQKVIDKASDYIGVKESPANSNKVLFTAKYGVITAWCGIFVKYLFDTLGGAWARYRQARRNLPEQEGNDI